MPSRSQMMTVGLTLVTLWAIHNVGPLKPVKDFLNFDQ
jgi:hypothetical protein